MLENLRALVSVARHGSFSTAARELGTSPSVVIKRVDAAEWRLGVTVFRRTTRRVTLSDAGQGVVPRVQELVHDFDELLGALSHASPTETTGYLRIKISPDLTALGIGNLFSRFLRDHPGTQLEVVLLARSLNPDTEGFDLTIDTQPPTYPDVTEIALCPLPLVLCATPRYLRMNGRPAHPRDLQSHRTLTTSSIGPAWRFHGNARPVTVNVVPRLLTADADRVVAAALMDAGVALIPAALVHDELAGKKLVPLLAAFAPDHPWITARVPDAKIDAPRIQYLISWLRPRLVARIHGSGE